MDIIFNRRSVRKYKDKPIEKEKITKMLKAAMRAPSAGHEQPWEFIVMKDKVQMSKIMEFHHYASMLPGAGCAIVICGNTKIQKYPYDFWVQDCSAATQNLLLEAEHLELGAVWLGVYPVEERVKGLQGLLGLPAHVIPLCAVALGYPSDEKKPLDTYLPERIHYEKWESKD